MEEKEEGCACLFEEERVVPYIPAFRRGKDKISGTVRGSAFHKVMELLKLPLFFADNEVLPREKLENIMKRFPGKKFRIFFRADWQNGCMTRTKRENCTESSRSFIKSRRNV